jgi:drug/metabolite transporter (DMT)-like permease
MMSNASANFRGIRCLLAASTCFALNDACNKFVVATLPASEIVSLRAIISGAIALAVLAANGELKSLRATTRPDIMARGIAESLIGPCLIISLAFMHQADVTAIFMIAPVFVALAGFSYFKEQFSWVLLGASLIALGGAWLFVNPGDGMLQTVALLPVLASCCQVVREIISRTIGITAGSGPSVSIGAVMLSTSLFSLVAGIALAIFFPGATPVEVWKWPNAFEWTLVAIASALFYGGVTFTYMAYHGSDLSVVAPFRYWYLVVAILSGFFVFGELPTARSIIGMLIIVAAGAIVLWSQRTRQTS